MMRGHPFAGRRIARWTLLLAAVLPTAVHAQAPEPRRTLTLDAAVLPLALVRITLIPGLLTAAEGELYTGEYQVRVSPLPIGSEGGRISVRVTREALRRLNLGEPVTFAGEAVSQGGRIRSVSARAIPGGPGTGQVRLRIVADGHKLVFQTGYRFSEP